MGQVLELKKMSCIYCLIQEEDFYNIHISGQQGRFLHKLEVIVSKA